MNAVEYNNYIHCEIEMLNKISNFYIYPVGHSIKSTKEYFVTNKQLQANFFAWQNMIFYQYN